MKSTITVDVLCVYRPLRFVLSSASRDASRPHLNAINLTVRESGEGHQAIAEATDGHRLAWGERLSSKAEGSGGHPYLQALVTRTDAVQLEKDLRPRARAAAKEGALPALVTLAVDSGALRVTTLAPDGGEATRVFAMTQERFPPAAKVWPTTTTTDGEHRCAVNPFYLADAAKAFEALKILGVQMLPGAGELDPFRLYFDGTAEPIEERYGIVVMPMRNDMTKDPISYPDTSPATVEETAE